MARHISGTYQRTDRARVRVSETVRLRTDDRPSARQVTLLELSRSDMLLWSTAPPPVGATVGVTIVLRNRYIEFEVSGVVAWHREQEFSVTFGHLNSRQTYGLNLALELERRAAEAAPHAARVAKGGLR